MEINNQVYNPNFSAKMIHADKRIEKYIKSSFLNDSKRTFATLDKFSEIYPDSVVIFSIKNLSNRDYLVAKNGVTGKTEVKLLHNSNTVNPEDKTSFVDLISKLINSKKFFEK